ncbi:thioesterase family protein [Streptomyces lydicus]|nr:thioesterase family protein [Streptomyces lydicus]
MALVNRGNSEFDRDTAVTRRAPGVYDAHLSAGWTIIQAVNGGYLLALMGRALGDALPHPDPLSVTAHYLTASVPGPAVIRTEVVRSGRTMSTGTASLVQFAEDGSEVERLRVLAAYGDLDALPDDVRTTAKPPDIPPYEHCLGTDSAPDGRRDPRQHRHRRAARAAPGPGDRGLGRRCPVRQGRDARLVRPRRRPRARPALLLLTVDALPPTAFEMGLLGWVPTVELTAHIRRRPAPGPLRVAITTRNLAGGFLEEDAEVWDIEDRLVAQSRQLARAVLQE